MKHHARKPREDHDEGMDRRAFVAGTLGVAGATLGVSAWMSRATAAPATETYAMPGAYPGRVVEVSHPGSVVGGEFRRGPVEQMLARGMTELTGADDGVSAWRSMFSRGDIVGVKVNPVGEPLAISRPAVIHGVVEGLKSAGVRPKDIIIFARFGFLWNKCEYDKHLPDGVRGEVVVEEYDEAQLGMKGYDPEVFCSMEFIQKGVHDPRDARTRRSHLCEIVSTRINKLVTLPVLKDHRSAGITGALKNMSHGLVNNVARSHGGPAENTCNVFIPTVCSMKPLRTKAVLHIMDGLVGVYEKGPFGPRANAKLTWPYKALLFATDPVAMDMVEWQIVDAKRASMNLPPVAKSGKQALDPQNKEDFDIRQPQHVIIAGTLGLGVANRDKIEHRKISLA